MCGVRASFWTAVLKPSRRCAFTPRVGLVRVFSMVPVLTSLTRQLIESRESILQAFDLSNNSSLRSLEIEIPFATNVRLIGDGMSFLGDILSTVTSPMFSDVVIVLPEIVADDTKHFHRTLFGAVRDMCEVKSFRLFFLLGRCRRDGDDWERLRGMIGAQAAEGGFGPLLHPPVIISYTRAPLYEGSVQHRIETGFL